jgi:N,N'-diacetyllegionaminate synthase
MTSIRIGDRILGEGRPAFLAAEIGINHNGDMDLAHREIDAAADAGADGVKFQNFRTEDFLSDRTLTYDYVSQGKHVRESQYDMFKRCELSPDALRGLREHCDRRGVTFFSTPMSESGVDDLVAVGTPLLKNGSDCLGHLPLIRAMAHTKLPTVLSTGMATLAEIDEAVRAFREAGGRDLVLLHCTSSYPTPPADVNLRKIPALASVFGALGACFIEKHFTLDKNLPGPDHRFSADPAEFRALADAVRTLEKSLGTSVVGPARSETEGRLGYRLSCVAARDLRAGDTLSDADVVFRRPGTGLPPAVAPWFVNRRLGRDVPRGKVLEPSDFT